MAKSVRHDVINAISDLKLRVTAGDVSSRTGIPLHLAVAQLNKVAAETGGALEVAGFGDIVYKFTPGFRGIYQSKGLRRSFKRIVRKVASAGFYLVRMSFGLMLILSLLAVVLLILAVFIITTLNKFKNLRSGGGSGGSNNSLLSLARLFNISNLSNMFSWNYTESRMVLKEKYPKGNFFQECFSFLFGDGDPNYDSEWMRWQLISELIRQQNGVVTAEQLAPYTGIDLSHKEGGALTVLVRFDGQPIVTETGNIVYVFPSLQKTAKRQFQISLSDFFEEKEWNFSSYSPSSLLKVSLFASLNFCGSLWLYKHVATILLLHHFVALIDILISYGSFFMVIPIIRYIVIVCLNIGIMQRNADRARYFANLSNPTPELTLKLTEAQQYALKLLEIKPEQIIYSTDKDILEQKFEK
jgi:hypothetical protein